MKKITFTKIKESSVGRFFWQPWGWLGCFTRILAFLAILALVMWLLNLLRGCDDNALSNDWDDTRENYPDIENIQDIGDEDPIGDKPLPPTDDVQRDIPNPGPNLPTPEDNKIPPINEDDIEVGDDGRQIVGNRLNVIFEPEANDDTFRQWANEFKSLYPGDEYSVVFYDPYTKMLQIQVPASHREQVMQRLPRQIRDIPFKIFPDGIFAPRAINVPNDPVFKYEKLSWYFQPIQAFGAWEITEGDPGVKIAIVDSYFDLYHDDLYSDRILYPYSVWRRDSNVAPEDGCDELSFLHGSMVASQALGNKDNKRGTAGIAPKCSFIPVSVGYQATNMTMLCGILYAINRGANVINISMGASFDKRVSMIPVDDQIEISRRFGLPEQDVWDYVTELADKRNVTLVWASGNEDVFTSLDPSKRCDSAIRVSAVDEKLAKADFSNFGNFSEYNIEESTISAPGVNIFGAMPFNAYNIGPGTSFSAPIVTGAVALMKSLDPTLTNEEIIDILQKTGRQPSDGNRSIGPVIQIKDALLAVQSNFVKYDDILNDHNKLVGLWQSTELLRAMRNGVFTGEMVRQYFEFTSPDSGRSIIYETGSKTDFTARLEVTWTDSDVSWQMGTHTSPSSDLVYVAANVQCRPDKNGLLQCIETSAADGSKLKYYIKKVKSRTIE